MPLLVNGMGSDLLWKELFFFGFQIDYCRVDAVALAGGGGAVLEDVAEVAAAVRADDFCAGHAMTDVRELLDGVGVGGGGEAGPAAVGVELVAGGENDVAAAGTGIVAVLVRLEVVFAGKGAFGVLFSQDSVLQRGQSLFPLRVGQSLPIDGFLFFVLHDRNLLCPVGFSERGSSAGFVRAARKQDKKNRVI